MVNLYNRKKNKPLRNLKRKGFKIGRIQIRIKAKIKKSNFKSSRILK